jgi:hypothetical protein
LRIFLNYRRDETSGHAGRLYDALTARFGEDNVFMDIDRIEPGLDFTEVIGEAVSACDVLIALVGSRWATAADAKGTPRLENPEDFVRLELEAALRRDVRVIPALVQNAEMPSSDDLPEPIRPFARRHALELSDTRWAFDVGKLVAVLERLEAQLEAQDRPSGEQQAERRPAPVAIAPQGSRDVEGDREPAEQQPAAGAIRALSRRRTMDNVAVTLAFVSGIVALTGSVAPWAISHASLFDSDIAFVPYFRLPVLALMIGATALVGAFVRRRNVLVLSVAALVALTATALTVTALRRVRDVHEQWPAVAVGWGIYVALVGSACLLLAVTFLAACEVVRRRRSVARFVSSLYGSS